MKVIFLDYDGVINRIDPPHYSTPVRTSEVDPGVTVMTMAEPELVYRLNLLVDRTDCELVLSSSWRHAPDWELAMRLSGIIKPFLGRTGRYSDHHKYGIAYDELCRGHNIQDWLDEHPEVERYAIIDDSSDMLASQLPNFFRTDTRYGLTKEVADAIELHFSRPYGSQ
jgi:hypothetical protein